MNNRYGNGGNCRFATLQSLLTMTMDMIQSGRLRHATRFTDHSPLTTGHFIYWNGTSKNSDLPIRIASCGFKKIAEMTRSLFSSRSADDVGGCREKISLFSL